MDQEITVERVGGAVLVHDGRGDAAAAELAAALPVERHRTAVVVGAAAAAAVARLDPWVVADLDEHVQGGVRLLAAGAGAAAPGALPPARLLADRLGVEVIAPDGPLTAVPGGVFVPPPGTGWVAYRPDGGHRRGGPRHPAPWWQDDLPADLPPGATQVPLGVWVRHPDAPARDDEITTCPQDPARPVVVVGAPGEQPPEPSSVRIVLKGLSDAARDCVVLLDRTAAGLAQPVADELGAPVRVLHGLPTGDGTRLVHVAPDGTRTWQPFALESVYRPTAPPVVDRWVAPLPRLPLIAPAAYRLAPGWRVDVVARGLLVRPDAVEPDPAWHAPTGSTADVLLAAGPEVPAQVVAALDSLIAALPADAKAHLRVVPLSSLAAEAATRLSTARGKVAPVPTRSATRTFEHVIADVVVTADGRVLPATLVVANPRTSWVRATAEPTTLKSTAVEPTTPKLAAEEQAAEEQAAEESGRICGELDVEAVAQVRVPAQAVAPPHPVERALPLPPLSTAVPAMAPPPMASLAQATTAPPLGVPSVAAPSVSAPTPRKPAAPAVDEPEPADTPEAPAIELAPRPLPSVPVAPEDVPAAAELPPLTALTTAVAPPVLPQAAPEPAAVPPAAPAPALATEVPPDARSTPEQRHEVRQHLANRYDVAVRAVARLLAERPGMRTAGTDHSALVAELAVVRVFALNPSEDFDTAFHTCLAAGLRLLPTLRGVVVRGLSDLPAVGDVLRTPAPVLAVTAASDCALPGVELLIWTTAARRLSGLVDDDQADDVVLPAQTRLRVLAVEDGRVLAVEDGLPVDPALTRLRAAATRRADASLDPVEGSARWCGALPVG
ncbi:hypothetical protein [Actinokineospora bangkokensis]|uniref:Uncharacterized protein n=1 Tax=Actinokineospora bangkokensis TaxID=1193682 RepID=A0A1Q9LMR7_9PSEU|nr:hypothetical protein [Actinokineospora bangkokensis]OLR93336.1 hypothetical protein BJP25_17855 [Actinokineospora bangkokensis]